MTLGEENPEYTTPPEGTLVGVEWKLGQKPRRYLVINGVAKPETETTEDGDDATHEDDE
jgi:hypothetical protein